eukprot:10009316-Lingulodinium_polyedra.AAC.1
MNDQLVLRLRQFAFAATRRAYLEAMRFGPLAWPSNFLPPRVDCYTDDNDPAGFSFVVNTTHP